MSAVQNHNTNPARFKIVAQNRGDELVIEIADQKNFLIRKACDIVKDIEFLQNFSCADVARIGVIAGMEMNLR